MVYFRSFATGHDITFTVQIDAPVYNETELPYYEASDTTYTQPFEGAGPIEAVFFGGQRGPGASKCSERGLLAGARCMKNRVRERLRDGLRNAAIDAGIGGAVGCRAAGLAGCIAGAKTGAGFGFISGVIGSMIWGTDFDCQAESQAAYDHCIWEYEACRRSGRRDCQDR